MKNYILILLLSVLTISAFSQSDYSFGEWDTMISVMPSARSTFSAVTYHDSIFIIGGFRNLAAPENVSPVDVYIPATDTWIPGITEFPFSRGCSNACLIGDKIFVFGGLRITGGDGSFTAYDSLHIYDIPSNRWERGQSLPTALCYFAADTIDGKIYVAGGGGSGYNMYNSLYVYDPELDEWTEKAPMSTSRWGTCARSWKGKLYVFGGYAGSGWTISKSIEVYDPEKDEWTSLSDAITPRTSMTMYLLDGQLFVIGGYYNPTSTSYNHTKIISRYDIESDSWFDFFHEGDNIPEGRRFSAYTRLYDRFYLFGGGGDADIMNNAWSYSVKSVRQVKPIDDIVFGAEDVVIDLNGYFSSMLDEPLTYEICPGYDETVIHPGLENSVLTVQKLGEVGESPELRINVLNTEDTISSNAFKLEIPVAALHQSSQSMFAVFPNPASDIALIEYSLPQAGKARLEIYSATGQVIQLFSLDTLGRDDSGFEWNVKDLRNGLYFVVLKTRSTTSVCKVLVNHE